MTVGGEPVVLLKDGRVQERAMAKGHVTLEIGVLKKRAKRPIRQDLRVNLGDARFPARRSPGMW